MKQKITLDLDMNMSMALAPKIETFEVVAKSPDQKVDEGWWYQVNFGGFDLGEPEGPYPSEQTAILTARSSFLD